MFFRVFGAVRKWGFEADSGEFFFKRCLKSREGRGKVGQGRRGLVPPTTHWRRRRWQ